MSREPVRSCGVIGLLFDCLGIGMDRPFDGVDAAVGSRVVVTLKSGDRVAGVLARFDEHLNLWMEDASHSIAGGSLQGAMVIRGSVVESVSPVE